MAMIRGGGPEWEGESLVMGGDNISMCSGYSSATRVKDTSRTRDVMSLMGVLEDWSRWCFYEEHAKEIKNTIADGVTKWESRMLPKELTKRRPNVK